MKKNYFSFVCLILGLLLQNTANAQCGIPVSLGTANNMVGLIRNNSSAIAANKTLNTITFIHRHNTSLYGGNSGHLRFDVSTNGGATWTLDQGVINTICNNPSRYPNVAIYNPAANTNTANAYLSYMAPTISTVSATFNGVATGVSHLNATGTTETYNQNGIGTTMLPSSLATGSTGVFWAIEPTLSATGFNIYKGVWNGGSSDVVWSLNYNCTPTFLNFPSTVTQDYNIAFDPSGTYGWFCFTAHVSPGPSDASLYPVLYKTTDGGNTWTGPITVDVTKFSCITSNTVSGNFPSINDAHDLAVDVNGNPHILTTLGNSSSYVFNYSLWHHMYDITFKNGFWVAYDLGNVNCGPNTWGVSATTFAQKQAPQASRSADGTKLFFTWTDNSSSSLGAANNVPDLFGKAYNVSNDTWTPTKNFTSCNSNTAGKMIFPHCAAEVLEPNSTTYLVPTMYGEPSVTNDLDQIANFKYLDNVTYATSEFSISTTPATVTISPPAPILLCQTGSVTLSVGSVGQAIWSNSATTTSISISSGTATTYSVIAQIGCNVGTASLAVANVSVNAGASGSPICPGSSATFTALGNALGYTWTPGSITGTNVSLGPLSTNMVTLTTLGTGSCNDVHTVNITLLPQPTLVIAGNNTICAGTVLTQTVNGAQTYLWDNSSTNATFTDTPTSNTTYTVTGTAANTCTNTKTVSVVVKPAPSLTAGISQTAACTGETLIINASGAATYSWNGVSSTPGQTITASTTTIFMATGAGTNLCESSKTLSLLVYALPSISVTPARNIFCKGEKIKLTASGASTYTWVVPGVLNTTVQVNPTSNTTYTIQGKSVEGCTNTALYTLTVSNCTGVEENSTSLAQLRIYPNPNNGEFIIKSEQALDLKLINELGQIVKTFTLNETNRYEISVRELASGIYFLSGQIDEKAIRQKIIVSH